MSVFFADFLRDLISKMLVVFVALWPDTPSNGENQWGEGAMLDLHDSLVVLPLLLGLMLCIDLGWSEVALGGAVGICDLDVE